MPALCFPFLMVILTKWASWGQFWGELEQVGQPRFRFSPQQDGCSPQMHDFIQFPQTYFSCVESGLDQVREFASVRYGNYVFWVRGPLCTAILCDLCMCVWNPKRCKASLSFCKFLRKLAEAGKTWLLKSLVQMLLLQQYTKWGKKKKRKEKKFQINNKNAVGKILLGS